MTYEQNLIDRITYHLSSGGLFNPELADHLAVRNLLMECREALAQRTWVSLTDEEINTVAYNNHPLDGIRTFARAIESKLRSKNNA